jgi:hypothetical protein
LDDDTDLEGKEDSVMKEATSSSPKKQKTIGGKKEKEALKEYNSFNRVQMLLAPRAVNLNLDNFGQRDILLDHDELNLVKSQDGGYSGVP